MGILKISTEWARGEVFSSQFFILFGIMFVLGAIGFWKLGITELAKAFVFPSLVAGILLLTVGIGIYYANNARVSSFKTAFDKNCKFYT